MGRKPLDLSGKKFGKLTAVKPSGKSGSSIKWECKCDCGNIRHIPAGKLSAKLRTSCGCGRAETARDNGKKGGIKKVPFSSPIGLDEVSFRKIKRAWFDMMRRCYDDRRKDFKYYGAKGIVVCQEWHDFDRFAADMKDGMGILTLDRKNPFGNYEKNNCRWITQAEQNRNKRKKNCQE